MSEFLSIVAGFLLGWLLCALVMYSQVVKNCPAAEGTHCQMFGHVKVCVIEAQ